MKKAAIIIFSCILFGVGFSSQAHADTFNPGLIMSDSVFTDASSLTTTQIQQFLNSKVPSCDTQGTLSYTFNGVTMTGAQWAQYWYGPSSTHPNAAWASPPFTCLKDYSENGVGSAQIIYNAAQQYGISPKVLIILLQKEQGLVTDTWPTGGEYQSATGYGCPDTSVCNSQYYGLTNQINNAAYMFRSIVNASPTWYTPYVLGNNYILYNPNTSCGGSTVNIQNRATQALYNYTPYQPNAAALAAGFGSAPPCGAYGNRNFFLYYTSWFGSTTATASYAYSIVSRDIYSDSTYQTKITDPPTVEPNSDFYVKLVIQNTGNQVWQNNTLHLGTQNSQDRSSIFSDSSWLSPARPAAMIESSVSGGNTATFEFKMHAPQYLGYYPESFGVLIEGFKWLDGNFTIPVTVASANPYYMPQILSFEAYSDSARTRKLDPLSIANYTGSKVYMKITVKNAGNQTFPAGTTQVATANPLDHTSIFSDSSWIISQSRAAIAQEGAIAPQATGTFLFSLTSPATPIPKTTEQFGLVIDGVTWLSTNIGQVAIQTTQRPPSELDENQALHIGDSLLSYDGRFWLVLQGDGNLVLYSPNRALWSTQTQGKGGVNLIMQNDGNLVLYRADWTPVWSSNTANAGGGSKLIPQTDGNLVTYSPSWSPTWWSGTNGQQ